MRHLDCLRQPNLRKVTPRLWSNRTMLPTRRYLSPSNHKMTTSCSAIWKPRARPIWSRPRALASLQQGSSTSRSRPCPHLGRNRSEWCQVKMTSETSTSKTVRRGYQSAPFCLRPPMARSAQAWAYRRTPYNNSMTQLGYRRGASSHSRRRRARRVAVKLPIHHHQCQMHKVIWWKKKPTVAFQSPI